MYKIVRYFFNGGSQGGGSYKRTIKRGLTLEEAQAHCKNPETSSRTATSAKTQRYTGRVGPWFDTYVYEED